ncbi:RagB/SusD family nutrient uptake outer membrane protein [Pedobacter gandavensis]|uniref:RagB/SusD family nutrient uptake outer membrane protein n=1 Tax=Pedobacter gandavensis TaxID=2679963 RepID=UPI00292F6046|nr:RagB/SusD family nutrient uptake outer membrane protein [Pedobacter gandavensis]
MKNIFNKFCFILCFFCFLGCKRTEFLDKKPSTNLIVPKTLKDFQQLLDNYQTFIQTGVVLPQLASDEYTLSYQNWQVLANATERNSYIWASDIYQGESGEYNWNPVYTQIFYANSILEGLAKSELLASTEGRALKGAALFIRAIGFYDLTRNYCKAYDAKTAHTDLGIPLRLKAGIDYIQQRSTLQESLDQILNDLSVAENLLPSVRSSENLNRPTRIAVYALLARIYLDMRDYVNAERFSDKCLSLYSKITDYNLISKTASIPFTIINNDELIYISTTGIDYDEIIGAGSDYSRINQDLISLYSGNDLRLQLYFSKLTDGSYNLKRSYAGNATGFYPFFGLATDEVYLIKAECLARRNEVSASMDVLNALLIKRFHNSSPYVPVVSNSASEALSKVLIERRKELVWRGLRWFDLKRLNKEGANITLTRTLNGVTYTLPPNDLRWVFPIYPAEVALSGIVQNPR